jgi:hypothetical protein
MGRGLIILRDRSFNAKKLNEKKSRAVSPVAKAAPAEFLWLTHNLLRRLEEELATQEGVINPPDYTRRAKRLAEQKAATHQADQAWPNTWDTFLKPVQNSVKLIRWLRTCIASRLTWIAALPRLQALYGAL